MRKERLEEQKKVMQEWGEYIGPLQEAKRRRKEHIDWSMMSTLVSSLSNLKEMLTVAEATQSINVGNFIQHGYDLVTAIYPNLVSNYIASTQPLSSRAGEVWYYDLQYETAKGFVSANSAALSATIGLRADKRYSSEYIDQTPVGLVNGVNLNYSGTIPNAPLRTNAGNDFFFATDGVENFTVNPANFSLLIGDKGGSGTLNTTTGAYTLVFNTAPVVGATLVATGKINFESLSGVGQGRTKISLTSKSIFSQKHQLITDYTLDSEHDLKRNFNKDIASELIKSNAALIRAELDQLIMFEIKESAKDIAISSGSVTWDASIPTGIAQLDHFRTLLTVFKSQANDIYAGTRMVHGNFVLCGNDIATVVEVLPEYQANPAIGSELTNSGPYVAGKIGSFLIIKNPDFDDNEWVVGNRGNTAFNTGYILAPYKPLMVTPPTSDASNPFSVTRGLWLDAGRLVVNAKYYSYGRATNLTF
jgi:hypothetical protein